MTTPVSGTFTKSAPPMISGLKARMLYVGRCHARVSYEEVLLGRILGGTDCMQIAIGNLWVTLFQTLTDVCHDRTRWVTSHHTARQMRFRLE